MKNLVLALALFGGAMSAQAGIIGSYQDSTSVPSFPNNLANAYFTSGSANGGNGSGVNLTYTFGPNTEYVFFNNFSAPADKEDVFYAEVTTAGNTVVDFGRAAGNNLFWAFSTIGDDISSVRFYTQSSANNTNVNNDKLDLSTASVGGYIQPAAADAKVPEPATVALLGFGLLGFALTRRTAAKRNNF